MSNATPLLCLGLQFSTKVTEFGIVLLQRGKRKTTKEIGLLVLIRKDQRLLSQGLLVKLIGVRL